MEGKIIIISAPSGCGKSTIINRIFERGNVDMEFSVSATNRPPRPGETDGVNYHFLSTHQFNEAISNDAFVEYEEVYPGRFYGTLRSEIDKKTGEGKNVVLDIDVKGGVRVKDLFGSRAVSLFIMPPDIEALRSRLEGRGTETPETIRQRIDRAEEEISFAPRYDHIVVNDDLEKAVLDTEKIILSFTHQA